MAKTYTISEFNSLIKKVEQIDTGVKDYLQLAGFDKWTRMYETVNSSFTLSLKFVENINNLHKKARKLLIDDFKEKEKFLPDRITTIVRLGHADAQLFMKDKMIYL